MDHSRPSKCTESSRGAIIHNGTSHEVYPRSHSRPAAPMQCPMENCKWIGETYSYEEHRSKKHAPFTAEPVPLIDATHIVVPKEEHDKLQDELGKLTHDLDQSRRLESEKEKEWREAKEARERRESDLMNCCKRISSQSSQNVDPVIHRGVVANQQVEANSTASLGRAQQLPQQERSRTLDAEGSDFQQYFDVFEQEGGDHHGDNYEQPQPQSEQQNRTKEALVVARINVPAGSESPPPLPPKPKQDTQKESSSADLIPPKLPPKPNSNRGPSSLPPGNRETSMNSQQHDTIPPPRPPKPSQAKAAVPQPQRRRRKSPPPPPQDYENGEERREWSPSSATDENSMGSVNCGECPADCSSYAELRKLRESNERLRKNYDRLKEEHLKCGFNSNTKQKARRSHSE